MHKLNADVHSLALIPHVFPHVYPHGQEKAGIKKSEESVQEEC